MHSIFDHLALPNSHIEGAFDRASYRYDTLYKVQAGVERSLIDVFARLGIYFFHMLDAKQLRRRHQTFYKSDLRSYLWFQIKPAKGAQYNDHLNSKKNSRTRVRKETFNLYI